MFKNKALKFQRLTVLWTIVILVLCNMKTGAAASSGFFFEGFDKMTHLGLFFILTVLSLHGSTKFHQSYRIPLVSLINMMAYSTLLGGMVEFLQWKVFNYRSAEWWDLICDIAGSAMAVSSYLLIHSKEYGSEKV